MASPSSSRATIPVKPPPRRSRSHELEPIEDGTRVHVHAARPRSSLTDKFGHSIRPAPARGAGGRGQKRGGRPPWRDDARGRTGDRPGSASPLADRSDSRVSSTGARIATQRRTRRSGWPSSRHVLDGGTASVLVQIGVSEMPLLALRSSLASGSTAGWAEADPLDPGHLPARRALVRPPSLCDSSWSKKNKASHANPASRPPPPPRKRRALASSRSGWRTHVSRTTLEQEGRLVRVGDGLAVSAKERCGRAPSLNAETDRTDHARPLPRPAR